MAFGDRVPAKDIDYARPGFTSSSLAFHGIHLEGDILYGLRRSSVGVRPQGELVAYNKNTKQQLNASKILLYVPDTYRNAAGVWGDGTTIWVAFSGTSASVPAKLFAWNIARKLRDTAKDITIPWSQDTRSPTGLWGDGTTIWAAFGSSLNPGPAAEKLIAFNIARKARDASKDITLGRFNEHSRGIWGDGTTIWSIDTGDTTLDAFVKATGARDSAKDINLTSRSGEGVTGDSDTIYIQEFRSLVIRAYDLKRQVTPAKPPVPSNFTVLAGDGQVTLSWSPAPRATSYDIRYRRVGTTAWTQRNEVTATGGTISGLSRGVEYEFQIRAENSGGHSDWSSSVKATPPAPVVKPGVPTGLVLVPTDNGFTASWNRVSGAAAYDLRYRIGNGPYTTQNLILATGYSTGPALAGGTTYRVSVRAISGSGGIGDWSSEVSVTARRPVPRPAVPGGLRVVAGDASVAAFWNAVTGATHYDLRYRIGTGAYTTISDILVNQREIDGLVNLTTYKFSVRAGNSAGDSDWSSEVEARPVAAADPLPPVVEPIIPPPVIPIIPPPIVPPPQDPPPVPGNLVSAAGDSLVTLSWTEAPRAVSYGVRFRLVGTVPWSEISGILSETYSVRGLVNGNEYEFAVRALNVFGPSTWTEPVRETPAAVDVARLDVPENFTCDAGNGQVSLDWDPADHATSYEIRHRQDVDLFPRFPTVMAAEQSWEQNADLGTFQVPAVESGDAPITYAASGLPAGVSFDGATRRLTGTPTAIGTGRITITAEDADGDQHFYYIPYRVTRPDLKPVFMPAALSKQTWVKDVPITTFQVPAALSGDAPVTYSATALPSGLSFDPATRRITGTPTVTSSGTIVVTARDADGDAATLSIPFEVLATAPATTLIIPVVIHLLTGTFVSYYLPNRAGSTIPANHPFNITGKPLVVWRFTIENPVSARESTRYQFYLEDPGFIPGEQSFAPGGSSLMSNKWKTSPKALTLRRQATPSSPRGEFIVPGPGRGKTTTSHLSGATVRYIWLSPNNRGPGITDPTLRGATDLVLSDEGGTA